MNQQTDLLAMKAAEAAERVQAIRSAPAKTAPEPGRRPDEPGQTSRPKTSPRTRPTSRATSRPAPPTWPGQRIALLDALGASTEPSKSRSTEDGKATPAPVEPVRTLVRRGQE